MHLHFPLTTSNDDYMQYFANFSIAGHSDIIGLAQYHKGVL